MWSHDSTKLAPTTGFLLNTILMWASQGCLSFWLSMLPLRRSGLWNRTSNCEQLCELTAKFDLLFQNKCVSSKIWLLFYFKLKTLPIFFASAMKVRLSKKTRISEIIKVNQSVYIANRTYRFCCQYVIILVRKTWLSALIINQL